MLNECYKLAFEHQKELQTTMTPPSMNQKLKLIQEILSEYVIFSVENCFLQSPFNFSRFERQCGQN